MNNLFVASNEIWCKLKQGVNNLAIEKGLRLKNLLVMHLMYSYFIFHFQDIRLVSRNGQIG
jgi:hypothetical protein